MDAKLRQLSKLLKRYDSDLFPRRSDHGALGVFRRRRSYDLYRYRAEGFYLWISKDHYDLALPITDTWVETGTPVDWGIEPIFWKIQELDGWRDDGDYDRFAAARARQEANDQRALKNEIRAMAADSRRDFARATNDINTSTLAKLEKRRKYDGCRR